MTTRVERAFDPYAMSVTTAQIDALDHVDGLGSTRSQLGTAMRIGKTRLDFTQLPDIPAEVMHVTEETLDAPAPAATFQMGAAPALDEMEEEEDEEQDDAHADHQRGEDGGEGEGKGEEGVAEQKALATKDGAKDNERKDYDAALSDISSVNDEMLSEEQRELEELQRAELWASIKKKMMTIKTVEVPKSVTINSQVATLRYWLRRLNGEEGAITAAQDHVDTMKMITGAVGQVSQFFRQQVGDMSGLTDAILGNEEELMDPLTKLFRARMGSAPPKTPEEQIQSIYLKRFGRFMLDHQLPQILSLMGGPATEEHPFTQQSPAELAYAQKQCITEADLEDIGPNGNTSNNNNQPPGMSWNAPPPMPGQGVPAPTAPPVSQVSPPMAMRRAAQGSVAGRHIKQASNTPQGMRQTVGKATNRVKQSNAVDVKAERKKLEKLRKQQAIAAKNIKEMAAVTKQLQDTIGKATDRVKRLKVEMEFTKGQLDNLRKQRAEEERVATGPSVQLPHAASVAGGDASVMFNGEPLPTQASVAKRVLSESSHAQPPRSMHLPPATPMPFSRPRNTPAPLPVMPPLTSETSPANGAGTTAGLDTSIDVAEAKETTETMETTENPQTPLNVGDSNTVLEGAPVPSSPPLPSPVRLRPMRSSARAAMTNMQAEMRTDTWAQQAANDEDVNDDDFRPSDKAAPEMPSPHTRDVNDMASHATTTIEM